MNIRRTLLSFALLAGISSALRADQVDSSITAVTVYLDRAVITRTAKVDVGRPGPLEVVFSRLPDRLADESLRVAGAGTAQATILDVTARASYVDFTPDGRVQALRDAIRGCHKARRALDDQIAVLKEREKSLDRIVLAETQPVAEAAPRLSLDDAGKLLLFLDEQRGKIAAERRSLDGRRDDLSAKQDAAEQQLAQLRGAGGRSYKSVTVRLSAKTAGTVELAVSYAVPGAEWRPLYDARATSAELEVQLGYFGMVRQNTGEDWTNVALTLSTARPSLGGAPPALVGWTVDVVRPVASTPNAYYAPSAAKSAGFLLAARRTAADSMGLSVDDVQATKAVDLAALAASARPRSADYGQADPRTQVTSTSFKIPLAATVLSDNSPQRVPIAMVRLAAETEYLAVPKLLAAAFLDSKVSNSSPFPLLAGAMNVFLDDTFVATGALRTVMPGEKFDLDLGVDDGIAVKRTLERHFTEDIGLMTKGKRITYEFTITAQNNKRLAERVVLVDQIPVSRNEKISVKLRGPAGDDAKLDRDGTLKWTLNLQPGEKREVPLSFVVEYPNGTAVAGLE